MLAAARNSGRYDAQEGIHACADALGDRTLAIIAFQGRDGLDVHLVRLADGVRIANYSTYEMAKPKDGRIGLEDESFELSTGESTIPLMREHRTAGGALLTQQTILEREGNRLVPIVSGLVTSVIDGATSVKRWVIAPGEAGASRPGRLLVKELVNPGEGRDFIERMQELVYDGTRYPVPADMRIKP